MKLYAQPNRLDNEVIEFYSLFLGKYSLVFTVRYDDLNTDIQETLDSENKYRWVEFDLQ